MLSASKTAAPSGGYNLTNSLRFRQSATAFLSRTPASASNRQTWTWSGWVKRGRLGVEVNGLFAGRTSASTTYTLFYFSETNTLNFLDNGGANLTTTQLFRDPSAWYHLVLSVDTTQATAANRVKMYVNGNQITAFSTATYPTQNANLNVNTTATQVIGDNPGAAQLLDGYLAEVNFVDGQALTPSSFGSTNATTGVWQPARYAGTYGTNGFYLKFSDIATTSGSNAGLGKDFSGNANYFNTNNISVTAGTTYDAMIDSPTLTSATVANYCTLNPVFGSTNVTLSEANLKAQVGSTGGVYRTAAATFGVSSGKWYWELLFGNPTTGNPLAGVGDMTVATSTWNSDTSTNANFWYVDASSGNKINGTGGPGSAYGSSFSTTDICMVALDMDNGKIWWGKNGTWFASGDPAAGTNAAYTNLANKLLTIALMGGCGSCGFSGNLYQLNFGQRPFSYTPPTGFVRLNTYNLPDSTIKKGNSYMDATTYTGNNASRSITNTGSFKPDFVWIKDRSRLSSNDLVDSVRGVNKALISDATTSEYTGSFISSFDSTGFSLPANTTSDNFYTNISGDSFVAWQWQAGQGSTSSNTQGTITSTVSVNTTAGFSIVTYTGNGVANATVGHGLGVTPAMVVVKTRSLSGEGWPTWHKSLGNNTYWLRLNDTIAVQTATNTRFSNFTSTIFGLGVTSNTETNGNGSTYVAYCWAEITGFSKFGSYTGNGSTDGPFVYTGFRPKFIMAKRTDTAGFDWILTDSSRSPSNVVDKRLFANTNDAESSATTPYDYLSNGFKLRNTNANENASGGTYIFMAFAENPFKNANAR